jgi:NAD-dependent dihydropyrimidine dehydrogenase PreA subunit
MQADSDAKLRPDAMWVDPDTCIDCGICEEVSPGIRDNPEHVLVSPQNLEAMSVCPTGSIRWLEGDNKE